MTDQVGGTRSDYRLLMLGTVVPIVFGSYGMAVPLYAAVAPGLEYIVPVTWIPALALIASIQWQVSRAVGTADEIVRADRLRHVRGLLAIPIVVALAALVLSGGALAAGLGRAMPALTRPDLVLALVSALLATAGLAFTWRARRIGWIAG